MFKTNTNRDITYYGQEYSAEIKRKNNSNSKLNTLDELFEIVLKA